MKYMTSAKENFNWVDAGRGLAILMVIAIHTGQHYNEVFIHFTSFGKLGVQLFFILSSFTLFNSYESRHKADGSNKIKFFYIRRFFRIAPLFYLALVFYAILEGWHLINVKFLIADFLFLNQIYLPAFNYLPPGGWSIGTEMLFYLFVPLFFKYLKNLKTATFFLIISILGSLFINIFIYAYITYFKHSSTPLYDGLFFNQLPVFILGIVLFHVWKQNYKFPYQNKYILISMILFFIFTFYPFSNIYTLPYSILSYPQIFSLIFVVFLIQFKTLKLDGYLGNILVKIGRVSFSMYLIHFLSIEIINYCFKSIQKANSFFLVYPIVILVTYIISSQTNKFEQWGIRLGKNIIKRTNDKIVPI